MINNKPFLIKSHKYYALKMYRSLTRFVEDTKLECLKFHKVHKRFIFVNSGFILYEVWQKRNGILPIDLVFICWVERNLTIPTPHLTSPQPHPVIPLCSWLYLDQTLEIL